MPKLAPLFALFPGLLLAQVALGQEVLVDQWTEDYLSGRKVGYAHIRVLKTAEGYREERREWWPSAGGMCREQSRTETDDRGQILSLAGTSTTPLGTTRYFGQREAKGFGWRLRYRNQPPLSGTIEGKVQDSGIVALLIARGKRKVTPEVVIRSPDLPEGVKERTFRARLRGDALEFDEEELLRIYDRRGVLLHELRYDMHAQRQAVTKAEAQDMRRVPEGFRASGVPSGRARLEGVELTSPGEGWGVAGSPAAEGENAEQRVMLLHPYRVLLLAQAIPVPLPADEKSLNDMAPRMSEALNRNSAESGTTYSMARATKAWGLPAIQFDVEGTLRGEETQGEAWIVRLSGSEGLLVILFGPSDKAKETAPLFRQAKAALRLEARVELQATTFPGGLKVELPESWRKGETRGRAAWTSPEGAYLSAWVQATPGQTPESFLGEWANHTATRLNATPGKVERVEVGGRRLFKIEVEAEKAGTQMKVRLITGQASAGQTFLMVAIDTTESPAGALDAILRKATWTAR